MSAAKPRLQALLDEAVGAGMTGASVCIGNKDGIIWQGQAGFADVQNWKPVREGNIFGIGSITKVFLSVVTLQLVEEGRLSMEDTVRKHLTDEIIHGIPNAATATIASLINHTSGIPTWEFEPQWIKDGRGVNCDPEKIWGTKDCLKYIQNSPPTERGAFHYSNTNFTILGLLVEKVTSAPAESEVRRRILEPLSLNAIFLEGFEAFDRSLLPRRYHFATPTFVEKAGISPHFSKVKDGLIDVTNSNLSVEWMAGGFVADPRDLVKFGVALRDGKLLKPESMDYMRKWIYARPGANISYGLFQFETEHGHVIGHNGGVLGFTASFWWAEKGDCVVALLSNVGTMHSGPVPANPAVIGTSSRFVELALEVSENA